MIDLLSRIPNAQKATSYYGGINAQEGKPIQPAGKAASLSTE
jgi:hypothetical protein